jgi:steroid delta-isomerase-like uncharacterized protein
MIENVDTMTLEMMTEFFARRTAAIAAKDAAAISADYAWDCVFESPSMGTVVGRPAVLTVFESWFKAFPDLTYTVEELVVSEDRVAAFVMIEGTDTGGFLGLPPTRKPFRSRGVFLYRMKGQEILHERRLLDFSSLLLQLAGDVETATESARQYRSMLESARTRHELKTAAEIQRALLPEARYEGAGFEVVATSLPCRAIGGDFFDYFALSAESFGLVLGDVAGKGPPAALLASALQGIFAASTDAGLSPADTLNHVNDVMVRRWVDSRFATVLYAVLSDGRLTYSNGGHNPPILIGSRGVRRLDVGGLIVGAFRGAAFEDETVQLQRGDVLVVFSDGVTEALNEAGDEFGEERLLSCLKDCRDVAAGVLLEHTISIVQAFTGGAMQSDDLTMLVLRYTGS